MDYSIVAIAEKLSPATVPQLKQHVNSGWNEGGFRPAYDPELSNLINSPEATPDQLLSLVSKYPNSRQAIVQNVANRYAQQGDMGRAAELIKANFADDTLDEAMRNLDQQYSNSLISQGRFIEAERVIDQFPENSRFSALISLATIIFQKDNTENRTYAIAVVSKAIALLPEKPETSSDMSNFMQVIRAYSDMEPGEAYRMYQGLVPQLNELTDAAAVINGFQGGGNVREGEFLLSQGYWINSYGVDVSMFRSLANKDFNGTVGLIGGFSRREIRISMKVDLASSL
jgi:tetratricopeptide (TPR) repeat protein